jgi:hypothetical protein
MIGSVSYMNNGNAHVGNYKKALLSVFDKKEVWNYLMGQRKRERDHKKEASVFTGQIIYW